MSDKSAIEWTDATWNPVTGCTQVSPGCDHCYALTFAERFRGVPGHPYEQGFDMRLWRERPALPLGWAKPRRIFVQLHVGPLPPGDPDRVRRGRHRCSTTSKDGSNRSRLRMPERQRPGRAKPRAG